MRALDFCLGRLLPKARRHPRPPLDGKARTGGDLGPLRCRRLTDSTAADHDAPDPPPTAGSDGCIIEHGIDYNGGDIPEGRKAGASIGGCIKLCEATAACTHVTFIWGSCYLKNSGAGSSTQRQGTSADCSGSSGAAPIDSEPTAPPPTTSEPTAPPPTTSEPTTSEPTTSEPTISEPTTSEPTTSEPTELASAPTEPAPTAPAPAPTEPSPQNPNPPIQLTDPTGPSPTPPPTSLAVVEYTYDEEFGHGCCRTTDGVRENEIYIQHLEVTDFATCADLCSDESACNGFELTAYEGCEIHTSPITHIVENSQCQCQIRHGNVAAPTETAPTAPALAPTEPAPTAPAPAPTEPALTAPAPTAPTPSRAPILNAASGFHGCTVELRTKHKGSSLGRASANSAEDCAAACVAHEACVHFTYFSRKCYFKDGEIVAREHGRSTSGVCPPKDGDESQADTSSIIRPSSPSPPPPSQVANMPGVLPQADFDLTAKGVQLALLPDAVNEAQGAEVNGKLYVFGGFTNGRFRNMGKETYEYNPATDVWSTKAQIPLGTDQGITHTANIVTPGSPIIYIAGGLPIVEDGTWPRGAYATAKVHAYHTDTDMWDALPDLPQPRGGCAGAVIGGHLHIFGGASFHGEFTMDHSTHWRLELAKPNRGWHEMRPISIARNHLGAAAMNGKLYAIGGQFLEDEGCTNQRVVEAWDPTSDRWTTLSPLPFGVGHISPSVVISPYGLLVVGGVTDTGGGCYPPGKKVNRVFHYDVVDNVWHSHQMNKAHAGASMVTGLIGNSIYAQHGNTLNKLDFTWTNIRTSTRQFAVDGAGETSVGSSSGISDTGVYAIVGAVSFLVILVGAFAVMVYRRPSHGGLNYGSEDGSTLHGEDQLQSQNMAVSNNGPAVALGSTEWDPTTLTSSTVI